MFAVRGNRRKEIGHEAGPAQRVVIIAASALVLAATASAAIAEPARNPAHDLAEKFSRAAEGATATKPAKPTATKTRTAADERSDAERHAAEQQRAYEEDMLARARAEAEARLKEDMAREQERAQARAKAEREARARADEQRAREKAAAEEAERKAAQALRQAEEARRAEIEKSRQREEAERLARQRELEARELAERLRAARRAREDARARAAAQAEAEAAANARLDEKRTSLRNRTRRLAERLERLEAERDRRAAELARNAEANNREADAEPGAPIITGATAPFDRRPAASDQPAAGHRVTVLLSMNPGKRGIRRWNKTADPMLCVEGSCYISNGADTSARAISRRKGFGPGIALGKRAGACNNSLTCVFRDVDLKGEHSFLQPIDLRILRHDRRESRRVAADPTCTIKDAQLTCHRPIESKDYRAWIVPEDLARQAGPAALKAALAANLPSHRMAHTRGR